MDWFRPWRGCSSSPSPFSRPPPATSARAASRLPVSAWLPHKRGGESRPGQTHLPTPSTSGSVATPPTSNAILGQSAGVIKGENTHIARLIVTSGASKERESLRGCDHKSSLSARGGTFPTLPVRYVNAEGFVKRLRSSRPWRFRQRLIDGRSVDGPCEQHSTHCSSRLGTQRIALVPNLGERWVMPDVDGMFRADGE
jgi:hypothetical protein